MPKKRLRVLFDARPGEHCPTGIGRYAKTVGTILKSVAPHSCFLLSSESGDLRWTPASPLEDELELPALLEREGIDVFHSPFFHLPALLPCRSIVTVHDAIPAVRPDLTTPEFAQVFATRARVACERADRIVCPSESAKADLVRSLGVSGERVRVVPECPSSEFRRLEPNVSALVRKRYDLAVPFVLVVGSLEERKNPRCVLEAVAQLPEKDRPLPVFVGPAAGFELPPTVRWLGVVPDADLVALLCEARALVFPSFYEGFGLPVVEAFACETPVLASNAGSIPEVAGDAAILFDPADPSALASGLRAITDESMRANLVRRGVDQLGSFSQESVRKGLENLYEGLVS